MHITKVYVGKKSTWGPFNWEFKVKYIGLDPNFKLHDNL